MSPKPSQRYHTCSKAASVGNGREKTGDRQEHRLHQRAHAPTHEARVPQEPGAGEQRDSKIAASPHRLPRAVRDCRRWGADLPTLAESLAASGDAPGGHDGRWATSTELGDLVAECPLLARSSPASAGQRYTTLGCRHERKLPWRGSGTGVPVRFRVGRGVERLDSGNGTGRCRHHYPRERLRWRPPRGWHPSRLRPARAGGGTGAEGSEHAGPAADGAMLRARNRTLKPFQPFAGAASPDQVSVKARVCASPALPSE